MLDLVFDLGDEEILVLKITGKVFDENGDLLKRYAITLRDLVKKHKLVVVVGGGKTARRYIEFLGQLGVTSNYWLDTIGIWISRINALALIAALNPYSYPYPATSLEEVLLALGSHRAVFMGGLVPGQSTASVLLQVAETVGVKRVYYFSAAGKVYNKDPQRYSDATPLSSITASELKSLLNQRLLPGEYALIDSKALDIAIRSGISVQVISYKEPEKIFDAIKGENPGSIILPK